MSSAGEFQQTRDGKAKIWNWQAKPGETGSWSGDRDKEGYANGFGDLTWYDAEGKQFGLFYGNMVHGKFDGGVNVHTGSRVSHAYFVNGERVTPWARGSAKSTMSAPVAAVIEQKKAEAEKQAVKEKQKVARAEAVTTPVPKKETPAPEKIAKKEPVSPPAERPVRGPETYHKEGPEKTPAVAKNKTKSATEEAAASDKPLSAEEELKRTEPKFTTRAGHSFAEPTAIPKTTPELATTESVPLPAAAPSEPAKETAKESPPLIQETPTELHLPIAEQKPEVSEQKPEVSQESPNEPAAKESPADVSVNALVGPPSALRIKPAASPENKEAGSGKKHEGPLTETEAVGLADSEARIQGVPLDQYDRPKIDHSQVKGRWTLFYGLKKGESSDMPAAFSVTVDDKTHQAELKK